MTLTELKYIVAVARERHFGRAAEACFVSQPTLSVGVKKLEEELGVMLFERSAAEITLTPLGEQIVAQAQRVLEQALAVKEIAKQGKDPLAGPLQVGVIYTIGPYLLPALVRETIATVPQMPLVLQENFTHKLLEMLRAGEIDCAIIAEPFPDAGLAVLPLYDEPFIVAVPDTHPWAGKKQIDPDALHDQKMLLLGPGHCFRDQVLGVCPEIARFDQTAEGIQKGFEGSSLETIRHMVAGGLGITVLPRTSVRDPAARDGLIRYLKFAAPVPMRRVVVAFRKTFTRRAAVEALADAVRRLPLDGVTMLAAASPPSSPAPRSSRAATRR